MPAGNVVDVAIERIADGMPVDCPALESGASDEDREFLKVLHVLDGLAGLHRSTDADGSSIDASVEETTDRIPGAALGERSDVWGRHRLLQKIGEGSFGSVYRAWDPELEREIAIKILHQRISTGSLKQRLRREGRALAETHPPNSVQHV